jgi:hypothetical protein
MCGEEQRAEFLISQLGLLVIDGHRRFGHR